MSRALPPSSGRPLSREELFTLVARFYALAVDAEGADGPNQALTMIENEAALALLDADVPFTYPDWYQP